MTFNPVPGEVFIFNWNYLEAAGWFDKSSCCWGSGREGVVENFEEEVLSFRFITT